MDFYKSVMKITRKVSIHATCHDCPKTWAEVVGVAKCETVFRSATSHARNNDHRVSIHRHENKRYSPGD